MVAEKLKSVARRAKGILMIAFCLIIMAILLWVLFNQSLKWTGRVKGGLAKAQPETCLCYGTVYNQTGSAPPLYPSGSTNNLRFQVSKGTLNGTLIYYGLGRYAVNDTGYVQFNLIAGAHYYIEADIAGFNSPGGVQVAIPTGQDSCALSELQPPTSITNVQATAGFAVTRRTGGTPSYTIQGNNDTLEFDWAGALSQPSANIVKVSRPDSVFEAATANDADSLGGVAAVSYFLKALFPDSIAAHTELFPRALFPDSIAAHTELFPRALFPDSLAAHTELMLRADFPDSASNHFRSGYQDSLLLGANLLRVFTGGAVKVGDSLLVVEPDGDVGINADEKIGYNFALGASITTSSSARVLSFHGSTTIESPVIYLSGKTSAIHLEARNTSGAVVPSAYDISEFVFSDHATAFINGLYFKESGYGSNSRVRFGMGHGQSIVMIRADSLSLSADDGSPGFYWNLNSAVVDNYVLTYDGVTGMAGWEAAPGAGSGSMTTVKSDGSQVGGADIVTLDFSSVFSVAESPDTEINIGLNNNVITGAHIALGSDAQGDVMYYNGTDWARLAAGTNGQVLHTQGAGANPVWGTDDTGGASADSSFFKTLTDSIDNFHNKATKNIVVSDTLKMETLTASRFLVLNSNKMMTTALIVEGDLPSAALIWSDTTQSGGVGIATYDDVRDLSAVYQPLDADLTTWAGVTPSANGQSLVAAANYAAMRGLLDLEAGTDFYSISAADAAFQPLDADLTTWAGVTPSANGQSLVAAANYAAMRTLLDLEAGTDFPALSTFNDHSARHEDSGADELAVTAGMMNAGTGASASTFWRGDNTWAVPAGSGDVSKVGTPVDNQIPVWTGDGTVEGNAQFIWVADTSLVISSDADSFFVRLNKNFYALDLEVGNSRIFAVDSAGNVVVNGTVDGKDIATNAAMLNEAETIGSNWVNTANPWAADEIVSTVIHESELSALETDPVISNLFNAHSVLYSVSDNTPAQLTVGEQAVVGRLTGGNISAVAIGISDNNIMQVDGTLNAGEYVRVTAGGFESRTEAEFKADFNLEIGTDVQAWDAQLDTWAGVTPSANGQSLVAAANYAAMRTLLDLEAGTDFPALSTFNDHSARHEDSGADELAVTAGMMNAGTGASASTFWRGDNTWAVPAGSGDVSKVGTPVDNQIPVWTGDGTVEGNAQFIWVADTSLVISSDADSFFVRLNKSLKSLLLEVGNVEKWSVDSTGIIFSDAVTASRLVASDGNKNLVSTITGANLNSSISDENSVFESRSLTVAGTANEITSSAGAQDLSANRTWTLSLPSALTFTGKTVTGGTYTGATSFEVPNGTSDEALTVAGQINLNETDEQLTIHSGSNGEVSGEVSISTIYTKERVFDPDAVCDGAVDRLSLGWIGDEAPEGIIIDEWKVSFEADPTTEVDLDLKYADAFIGVANAVVIDVLDTTAGESAEDTDANINGGAVVPNGKFMYLEFGTPYTETGHQITFQIWYHYEAD